MKRVVGGLLVLLTITAMDGNDGLRALLQTRQRARTLRVEISALRAQNARLRIRARELRHDPSAVEREARQALGLARSGEIVVTWRR